VTDETCERHVTKHVTMVCPRHWKGEEGLVAGDVGPSTVMIVSVSASASFVLLHSTSNGVGEMCKHRFTSKANILSWQPQGEPDTTEGGGKGKEDTSIIAPFGMVRPDEIVYRGLARYDTGLVQGALLVNFAMCPCQSLDAFGH